jgi:hypothetical protein
MKIIGKNFAGVPADEKYKMACGNAVEFFRLGWIQVSRRAGCARGGAGIFL